MTQREFLTKVKAIVEDVELIEKADELIAGLDKKNASRSAKPSKTQIENEPIKVEIVEFLAEHGAAVSATIAAALSTEERPISTNKAVALCNQLVKEEKLVAEDVKIPKVGVRKQYAIKECE